MIIWHLEEMTEKFRRQPPRLAEVFQSRTTPVYFVTFCTMYRQPLLANAQVHAAFRNYCEIGVAERNVAVGRYVIMPDHIHLFVSGDASLDLGLWVRGLKRVLGNAIAAQSRGSLRRPGFFDHLMRNSESYTQKWEYVCENPVRAGLVARAEDWSYQGEIVFIDRV